MSHSTADLGNGVLIIPNDPLAAFRDRAPTDVTPCRLAYAATHVVMNSAFGASPAALDNPASPKDITDSIDWDASAALRRRVSSHGFAIAEAMDTAQRFAIGWPVARRLIELSGSLNLPNGFLAGAGADQLASTEASLTSHIDAVVEQARFISAAGGDVILLPLPILTDSEASESTYVETYTAIIDQLEGPLFLHWLGPMFVPSLAGYFPGDSLKRILEHDPSKVRGLKLSLLDDRLELSLRRELRQRDQLLLTGDDFNFGRLILGGDPTTGGALRPVEGTTRVGNRDVPTGDFSHALLGILDGIAAPAGLALRFLAAGDETTYRELMNPCEDLGRLIFEAPTGHYKAGLAFLAWLDGHQDHPWLVNHEERARNHDHYRRLAYAAVSARALENASLAAGRLTAFFIDN